MILEEQDKAVKEKQAEYLKIIKEAARFDEKTTKIFAYCVGIALALIFFALLIAT